MEVEQRHYEFAGYRVDVLKRELFAPDRTTIQLTSKALDVLIYLIQHRDRVVDKDELLSMVDRKSVV